MTVLALDIATKTGWALHQEGMKRPFFGVLPLPKAPDEVGAPMEALRLFLADQHRMWNIKEIVFEGQHIGGTVDMKAIYKLIALAGMVEWFAHRIGARCYLMHIQTWRKHFIGRGTGLSRAEAKALAVATCQKLGWDTIDDDAAEACGILDCYLSMKPNYSRPWRDKMFMGGL